MALRPINTADPEMQVERILVYGRSGIGKTRFALSLPERYGDILYYAADENSEFLRSISEEARKRVHVLKPEGDDPIVNFQEFCNRDWSPYYPTVKTLVIDTYTKITKDAVQYTANIGAVSREQHYKIGDPANGGQVLPNRGDYDGVNSLSRGFIDTLFNKQRAYNIILVCHEDTKKIGGAVAQGGPAHPGWEMFEDLPSKFDTVIRLIREPVLNPATSIVEMNVIAITEHDGMYAAKMRENNYVDGNPVPRVVLDRDPINFWNIYDAANANLPEPVNV